ncbi:MAG: hypothetical protein JNM63_11320, partial [Spirochaetia bacterium]|nr:hypothetical protein [Spirochaetia bacterium]
APPRKPEEIRSLLGYSDGRANNNNTADVNKAIGVSSRLVANTLFFRPLERTIRKSLSLDYFHIDTDILALANQVNVGSSNYVPQSFTTTVSMGKYLGENFFIQSDLNLGLGGQTNTIGGSIGLEYDLKLFSLGTKFEILDFSQIPLGKNPFDLSVRLNKNWSF